MHKRRGRATSSVADASQDDAASTTRNLGSAKDRPCPFCHQPFTSSSLGRHLDLYIKDKNPKSEDGVHKVDEIRRMRGRITRRHTRTSSVPIPSNGKRQRIDSTHVDMDDDANSPPSVSVLASATTDGPLAVRDRQFTDIKQTFLNKLHWHATGVINDLPPRLAGENTSYRAPHFNFQMNDFVPNAKAHEQGATAVGATATELALKELLAGLQAATERVHILPPFDVDVLTMNFPALCLRLLPAPDLLFSSTPTSFLTDSWPLNPPGEQQHIALNSCVQKRILEHRIAHADAIDKRYEKQCQNFMEHIGRSFAHWVSNPAKHEEIWRLELMRAYAGESEKVTKLRHAQEESREEIEHLKQELNEARKWRRESVGIPMGVPFVSKKVAIELSKNWGDPTTWDYNNLISRWTGTAEELAKQKSASSPSRTTLSGKSRLAKESNQQDAAYSIVNGTSQSLGNQASYRPPGTMSQSSATHRPMSSTMHLQHDGNQQPSLPSDQDSQDSSDFEDDEDDENADYQDENMQDNGQGSDGYSTRAHANKQPV